MPAGRPKAFDPDQALEAALKVFWRNGYEGTSLSELTHAMGINRPSLYAAFGNKEKLFRKAVDRYVQTHACHVRDALEQPSARKVIERLLYGSIDLVTGTGNPRGCFLVQGALACGDNATPLRRVTAKRRARGELLLRRRLEQAQAQGELPANASPADLARYVTALIYGIAVQAVGGASRTQLIKVARTALRTWPS